MSTEADLRHAIQRHAKLPPEHPTSDELSNIIREAASTSARTNRPLSLREWSEIIKRHVAYSGPEYMRKGMDFSDLNALLATATARLRAASTPNAVQPKKK